jgi:predicted aspartyl protease
MPIRNCPLTCRPGGYYSAYLPIRIINPHTKKSQRTLALIDTGADECVIPSRLAEILGHKLEAGDAKPVSTGNDRAIAYSHTTTIKIYHPVTGVLIDTIANTPIDFMPVETVLLGVKSFLSNYRLIIDYPAQNFSLIKAK